jgi:hypothetical protein
MEKEKVVKLTWIEQFKLNYVGKSDEARELEEFMKTNYKGNSYIPWAVIERMTYMQDPDADFEAIRNEEGGFVHTDYATNRVRDIKRSVVDGVEKKVEETEIEASFFSHVVIVKATFLGKVMTIVYPIQDNAYNAPKIYDSNMVNKALQRAKAKAASSITGIGYKLYEGMDLQFEDDGKPTTPVTEEKKSFTGSKIVKVEKPKAETKAETKVETKVEPVEASSDNGLDTKFIELATEIKNDERFDVGFARFNKNLQATQGFTIDRTSETVEAIAEKLSKIMSIDTFMNGLRRTSKIDVK